jgi:hypothetical protein
MKQEILDYILDVTDKATFEKALSEHNLHRIYRRKKNFLLYKYFNGNVLHFSVFMTNFFNEFISEGQQLKAAQLSFEIKVLTDNIKRAKRYKSPYLHWVKEYNGKAIRYNELMKGANRLAALWNKRYKKQKQQCK